MISKLEIGKAYNIRGIHQWSSVNIDVYVVSITYFTEGEAALKTNIELEWLKPYNVPLDMYRQLSEKNSILYGVKICTSRDPITFSKQTKDNKLKWIFPDMIDYDLSTELIMGKTFKYNLDLGTYSNNSPIRPDKLNVDLIKMMEDFLKSYIGSPLVSSAIISDVLLPKDEYEKIDNERMTSINKHRQSELTKLQNLLNKEKYLNNELISINEKNMYADLRISSSMNLYRTISTSYEKLKNGLEKNKTILNNLKIVFNNLKNIAIENGINIPITNMDFEEYIISLGINLDL